MRVKGKRWRIAAGNIRQIAEGHRSKDEQRIAEVDGREQRINK
jgi:hypothetical protein